MSLHAFERRFIFDARLGRLIELLMSDYGVTWKGSVTLFSIVPTRSQEGFGLVHASKMRPCSPQFMQE